MAHIQAVIPNATVADLHETNLVIKEIQEYSKDGIRIYKHTDPLFVDWHDSAWACRPDGKSQGGQLLCATDPTAMTGEISKFSVLSWSRRKAPRVARSSLSSEMQEATEAEAELAFTRLAWKEFRDGSVDLMHPDKEIQNIPGVLIADCKSIYDSINRSESSCLGMSEKRTAIEALAFKQTNASTHTPVRWVHSHAMLADGLTKVSSTAIRILRAFIRKPLWRLVFDENFMSARKRTMAGLEIFDEVKATSRQEAAETLTARRAMRQQVKEESGQENLFSFFSFSPPSLSRPGQSPLSAPSPDSDSLRASETKYCLEPKGLEL